MHLLELGYQKNQVDPYVFMKEGDKNKKCFISLNVDGCNVAGDQQIMDQLIENLQNSVKLTVHGSDLNMNIISQEESLRI
jgi:cAMP phosphodiesterase